MLLMGGRDESVTLGASPAEVAAARRFVRRTLTGEVPASVSSDLQLIASELFTNAVEHGDNDVIELTVATDHQGARVTVNSRGVAPGVVSVADWSVADPDSITGRGLGIVRELADEVIVERDGEHLVVTASVLVEGGTLVHETSDV